MWSLRLCSPLPCVASSCRSSTLRCLSPHSRRLPLWHVTYCGYAHLVHFRTSCVPPSARRDSTIHGCCASIRWSHRRSWRTSRGASLRRDVRLRAPLRRVIRLSRRSTRHYCRQVLLVLDLLAGVTGTGGVPKTDQAFSLVSLGMARGVEEKGDPRTDHSLCMNACASADSPHPGGLATQTATPVSPACTDLGVSTAFSRDSEVRDGCPRSADVSVLPDGLDHYFARSRSSRCIPEFGRVF